MGSTRTKNMIQKEPKAAKYNISIECLHTFCYSSSVNLIIFQGLWPFQGVYVVAVLVQGHRSAYDPVKTLNITGGLAYLLPLIFLTELSWTHPFLLKCPMTWNLIMLSSDTVAGNVLCKANLQYITICSLKYSLVIISSDIVKFNNLEYWYKNK